jgi:hypothetical protein
VADDARFADRSLDRRFRAPALASQAPGKAPLPTPPLPHSRTWRAKGMRLKSPWFVDPCVRVCACVSVLSVPSQSKNNQPSPAEIRLRHPTTSCQRPKTTLFVLGAPSLSDDFASIVGPSPSRLTAATPPGTSATAETTAKSNRVARSLPVWTAPCLCFVLPLNHSSPGHPRPRRRKPHPYLCWKCTVLFKCSPDRLRWPSRSPVVPDTAAAPTHVAGVCVIRRRFLPGGSSEPSCRRRRSR